MNKVRVETYLALKKVMLSLDEAKEEVLAEEVRSIMDKIWYEFTEEELQELVAPT